ncbi:hypothetical protein I5Q34_08810 [Streptomyces sp. AV19]|uniref:hypothetical protein n=1 Tax=Streptomyces sp. AV19 TaxID=2793068 RepID=UPI0018FE9182|nr:hypothetical protein [Streptomyces sp. AV19]MBH1934389.1 hypothetical protein [Streptomyces sp. AV19]MDG4536239.1 hypothetical protein [Streptomyces sp. AV19]
MAWSNRSDTAAILEDNRAVRRDLGDALGSGLAELRGTLGNIRQELLDAVTSGVAELRTENRDLRRRLDRAVGELAEARQDIARARTDMESLRRHLLEARPDPAPVAPEAVDAGDDEGDGEEPTDRDSPLDPARLPGLLRCAAGIASATLLCHRDTWAFVLEQAARDRHFRAPGQVLSPGGDRVEAALSGRSLIAVLTSLWHTAGSGRGAAGDWALAVELYVRVAAAVERTGGDMRSGAAVTIVLDDRAGDGDAEGPAVS